MACSRGCGALTLHSCHAAEHITRRCNRTKPERGYYTRSVPRRCVDWGARILPVCGTQRCGGECAHWAQSTGVHARPQVLRGREHPQANVDRAAHKVPCKPPTVGPPSCSCSCSCCSLDSKGFSRGMLPEGTYCLAAAYGAHPGHVFCVARTVSLSITVADRW